MKIEQKPVSVVTSAAFKEFSFGIKEADMGMILEILRSKLYSNPIGAICREIASNSRDANREVENNVPIEISVSSSLLTAGNMTMCFKDYGPGITPERMADVFVNYGSSTKRDSDVLTGGFGLGAKTPFSYTDNFTIETVVGGMKYTYVAAIEEGRKGKIYCIDSVESCEPNGTSIIIPIKECDRFTFEKEVYKATIFWPMRPVYKNFNYKIEDFKAIYEDENFYITKQSLINPGYGLLLDGIFYPINSNNIDFARYSNNGILVVFKFQIGELTISANRETLQYDDKTKTAINKRFCELIELCKTKYLESYNKNKNWLEAVIFNQTRETNVYFNIVKQHIPNSDNFLDLVNSFDNRKITSKIDSVFQTLQFFNVEYDGKTSRAKTTVIKDDFVSVPMYFIDTPSYVTGKDFTIFTNIKQYYAIKPIDNKFLKYYELDKDTRKKLVKMMRVYKREVRLLSKLGFGYTFYSSVEKLKVPKVANDDNVSVRRTCDNLKVYMQDISINREYTRRGSTRPGTYCYIKTDGVDATFESGNKLNPSIYALVLVDDILQLPPYQEEKIMLYRNAVNAKLLNKITIIYANRNRGAKLASIFKPLVERLDEVTPTIIGQLLDINNYNNVFGDGKKWLFDLNFKSHRFSSFLKKALALNCAKCSLEIPEDIRTKYAHLSTISNLDKDLKDLYKLFPLLNSFSSYEFTTYFKAVKQYIEVLEADYIKNGVL